MTFGKKDDVVVTMPVGKDEVVVAMMTFGKEEGVVVVMVVVVEFLDRLVAYCSETYWKLLSIVNSYIVLEHRGITAAAVVAVAVVDNDVVVFVVVALVASFVVVDNVVSTVLVVVVCPVLSLVVLHIFQCYEHQNE